MDSSQQYVGPTLFVAAMFVFSGAHPLNLQHSCPQMVIVENQLPYIRPCRHTETLIWVAVEELKLSYHNGNIS